MSGNSPQFSVRHGYRLLKLELPQITGAPAPQKFRVGGGGGSKNRHSESSDSRYRRTESRNADSGS